jgi:hypothetical protein
MLYHLPAVLLLLLQLSFVNYRVESNKPGGYSYGAEFSVRASYKESHLRSIVLPKTWEIVNQVR